VYVRTETGSIVLGNPATTVSPPSARIEGLSNGTKYFFSVRAVNRPTFYAAVKSVYGDVSGVVTLGVSLLSEPADPVVYGTATVGPLSSEASSTPQPVVEFPPLADKGGCFIATAAYGSSLAPKVDVLRAFRQQYLRPYVLGRLAIRGYETWSPPLADLIRSSETLRLVVRALLWPIVGSAWLVLHGPWWVLLLIAGAVATAVRILLTRGRGAARA